MVILTPIIYLYHVSHIVSGVYVCRAHILSDVYLTVRMLLLILISSIWSMEKRVRGVE